MVSEAQKRAKAKYDMKTVQYVFRFRKEQDADIIARLDSEPSKIGYIRSLIRADSEGKRQ